MPSRTSRLASRVFGGLSACRVGARRHGLGATEQTLLEALVAHTRVTLNFHPDRIRRDGRSAAEGLLRDGAYRSQFDAGVTSGSAAAFPGGERDRWEKQLFGGAYHEAGGEVVERSKYGAFNVMSHADGGSPRFGSCYFELCASRRCSRRGWKPSRRRARR